MPGPGSMSGSHGRQVARRQTDQPRIVRDLDGAACRVKPGADIERQRVRVVQAAGVDPETTRALRHASSIACDMSQRPAPAPTSIGREAEIGELDVGRLAPVELEQTHGRRPSRVRA